MQNQYHRIADTLSILCVLQLGLQSAPNLQYFAPKAGPRKSDSKQDFITYDFSRKLVNLKFPSGVPATITLQADPGLDTCSVAGSVSKSCTTGSPTWLLTPSPSSPPSTLFHTSSSLRPSSAGSSVSTLLHPTSCRSSSPRPSGKELVSSPS